MATDFFERQAAARRNTKWLIVMFVFAVIGILGMTFVVTALAVGAAQEYAPHGQFHLGHGAFPWQFPTGASLGALALIGGGSLYKTAQLAGGGTVIAERLGGQRIYPNTTDQAERRLLNVVEEMALASGVPVPAVFMLAEEQGINAFAAGFSTSDAIIGVTRGCAEQLTRDQLQGVIAHEFSHILNGDMRLNLRLIGVLHGILLMGLLGREILRLVWFSGGSRNQRSGRGNPTLYLLAAGVAFMVIGFLGLLFGNLIKAAVSRQREFLADASAVQFTRNPEGIAAALKRIGAAVLGSKLVSPRAAEASHMYFAEGIMGLFATHPPLATRIRRVDPQWDGKYPPPVLTDVAAAAGSEAAAGLVGEDPRLFGKTVPVAVVVNAAEQVGHPTEIHRAYIQELIAALPLTIVDAAHEPYGARALIYAMLLDRNPQIRTAQLRKLEASTEPHVYELTNQLLPWVDELDDRSLLPLVDMTLPALRALSLAQYQDFAHCFTELVEADQRVGLFEWTLHQILLRHLRPQFQPTGPKQILYYGLQRLGEPCSVLLSTLARASQADDEAAFNSGARHLSDVPVRYLPPAGCSLNQLQEALVQLSQVAPQHRQRLVDACAATICADAAVEVAEAELLRGICDLLDCPMPPLLPGQRVTPADFPPRQRSQV